MRKIYLAVPLFIYLLCLSISYGKNYPVYDKEKNMTQQTNWTIDYAEKMMNESASISYGVTNNEKFNQIIEQKNKADPNALYVYSLLLLEFNVINERLHISRQEATKQGFDIMWSLSEKKHPQACEYIAKSGNQFVLKNKTISKQALLKKQLGCFEIATSYGLKPYRYYADALLFGENKDNVAKLLLEDSHELNSKPITNKAFNLYFLCAKETGDRYCLGRVAESYNQGIGVEKDRMKAFAWAKLTFERAAKLSNVYKTFIFSKQLNMEMEQNLSSNDKNTVDQMYRNLDKALPASF